MGYVLSFPTFIGLNTTETKDSCGGNGSHRNKGGWVDRLRIGCTMKGAEAITTTRYTEQRRRRTEGIYKGHSEGLGGY